MQPTARPAYVALGGGLLLCALYASRAAEPEGAVLYLLGAASGTALCCVGASRMPPGARHIWWALAAGQALFLLGDVLYVLIENVLGGDPYPSVADAAYLASYPALAAGLLWLVRIRQRGRQRAALLDAAILTTAMATAGFVFIVEPSAAAGGGSVLENVVAGAYPAADVLLLALLVQMFIAGMRANVASWALVGGIVALLVADLGYVASALTDTSHPAWIDLGYLASYLLIGFAAVHPSAQALSEPTPIRSSRSLARLAWLGAALILTPVTEFVAGQDADTDHHGSVVMLAGGCLIALLVVLRMADLVQQLQYKAVELAALARRDGLTGLANRRTWDYELSRVCDAARKEGTTLHIAVLDMDHFKRFNDEHGHTMGDMVLRGTTQAWADLVQGRGFLARYGGEEFTVLLPDMGLTEAEALLDQMRRAVTHDQTCSIGLATWDHRETPADLVGRADGALYQAKGEGRDRIVVSASDRPELAGSAPAPHSPAEEAPEARPAQTAP
ncbi:MULTISPECIES: GGDEF domain-containing protein [Nocardioides]|uniref:GGDEF domain-containing protein n=1 Tax=Nocardioides vastitatis TaxID=2568655 RepID=A0ABW0ZJ48_9ACTN|nr:GGDEF domain-containing protein [Nocardioides sp.]